jgi:hypothetical protein
MVAVDHKADSDDGNNDTNNAGPVAHFGGHYRTPVTTKRLNQFFYHSPTRRQKVAKHPHAAARSVGLGHGFDEIARRPTSTESSFIFKSVRTTPGL